MLVQADKGMDEMMEERLRERLFSSHPGSKTCALAEKLKSAVPSPRVAVRQERREQTEERGRWGHFLVLGSNPQGFPVGIVLGKAPGSLRLSLQLSLVKGEPIHA